MKDLNTKESLSEKTDGGTYRLKTENQSEGGAEQRNQELLDDKSMPAIDWKFLHPQNAQKAFYEEDPLTMKIESIATLPATIQIFDAKEDRKINSHPDEDIKQAMRVAMTESLDSEDVDEFVNEIFEDKLHVESWFSTKDNFDLLSVVESMEEP